MKQSVRKEIQEIIKKENLNCSIKEFQSKVNWNNISIRQKLSEDFIREFQSKVNWCYISRYQILSENFIREFQSKVHWNYISFSQKLSEDFIRKFKSKVDWDNISADQKLSEDFIREFQSKVYWSEISRCQKLSENFIREFQSKVNWHHISARQKLSENFIREFQSKVNWNNISADQKLSENFIREFQDRVDSKLQKEIYKEKTLKQKRLEVEEYAQQYNLKVDEKYLYAFRTHDDFGRGIFNKAIFYEKGKYYRDWHCNMRENEENSFGLGIFSKGNTPVKVKIEDWGVAVSRKDGKARVWGFEVI